MEMRLLMNSFQKLKNDFVALGKDGQDLCMAESTGGWEVLAAQIFYPDEYNGCYCACPDPIDFVIILWSIFIRIKMPIGWKVPFRKRQARVLRNYLGHVNATLQEMNYRELALGTKSK